MKHPDERLTRRIFNRLRKNGVSCPVIQNEDCDHAIKRPHWKVSSEVGVKGAILGVDALHIREELIVFFFFLAQRVEIGLHLYLVEASF